MIKHLSICLALLCSMAMPSLAVDCDNPVGVMAAFACSGPNRPPALEDQVAPSGFTLIFGDEPPPFGAGGRRINLTRDLVPVLEWRRARREFQGLADYDMPVDLAVSITEHTGGIPVAWESKSGKVFLAVIDTDTPLFRVPAKTLELKDAVLVIVHSMVARGGCVPKVPGGNGTDVLQRKNAENCGGSSALIAPDSAIEFAAANKRSYLDLVDDGNAVTDRTVVEVYRGGTLSLVEVAQW